MSENKKTRADYFFSQEYNLKQKLIALWYFVIGYISISSFTHTVRTKILIPLRTFHKRTQAMENAVKYCSLYAIKVKERLLREEEERKKKDECIEVTEEEQFKITNAIEFKQI